MPVLPAAAATVYFLQNISCWLDRWLCIWFSLSCASTSDLLSDAAAVILAGGAKGKRYALEHSRILIHQPSSEGGGQASDIEIQAKEIDRITRLQEDLLARHVIKSSEEIRKDIERDKILTSAEAVEYGIIDQVLASRKAKK
jgi:ATP-dependent Clp protease protease subunit